MKRFIIALISVLISLSSFSQESILGIKFGKDYNFVKNELNSRYGIGNVYENKGNLTVFDISVGDYTFEAGDFYFQYYKSYSYLYYVEFQKNYDVQSASLAKSFRESLASTLGKKYKLAYVWNNQQGYRCYSFAYAGGDPKKNPVCNLVVEKGKSKGGKTYIYVTLSYGPDYFVDETNDF